MMRCNLHTHTQYSDGIETPEAMVEQALRLGCTDLGFSDHAPVILDKPWAMTPVSADAYIAHIRRLKRQYAGRIRIYCGMEIDYFQGDTRGIYTRYPLDYRIGAIHQIRTAHDGRYHSVDATDEVFVATLRDGFGGDIRALATQYYQHLQDMVRLCPFEVVAHMDTFQKNNTDDRYYPSDAPWYLALVRDCAQVIAASGKLVEVNTSGIARGRTPYTYPHPLVLRELRKWDIPLILSADAHNPDMLGHAFEQATRAVREAGFTRLWRLEEGKWVSDRI